jgi:hypothetical protein
MAHPFRYFRKHQKAFLAVAAVLAIFLFVIGDAMFGYIGQGGGPDPNKEVASWKGGRLTAMELENLTQRRYFISRFLQTLMMTGAQRLMQEGGNPMQPSVPNFILNEGITPYEVNVNVVSTRILADQARKAGITISDDVINHFLKEVSFRRVSDSEIVTLLQQMRGGDIRGSEEQLFAGLRELLLGHAYMTSYSGNIRNVLPEQRWEDWRRINERISLEAVPVTTSDFIKDVPDPKDADLQAFYEEYKDAIGHQSYLVMGTELPSANPGFKEPRRVKLNYLLGDVNAWAEKYKDSVTEEEIADYYERNKRTQFVKSGNTPIFDESLFNSADETEAPVDEPADEAATTTDENAPSDEAATTNESTEAAPSADEEAPTAGEATGEAEKSAEPAENSEAPSEDQSGRATRRGNFRLAAFQNNEENVADEVADDAADIAEGVAAEAEEAADDENADADNAGETSAPENSETADEPGANNTSADENAAPAQGTAPADDAAANAETGDTPTEEEKPVEYVPLDEVREEIRMSLARDKAVVELRKAMDKTYDEMQSAYTEYNLAKFDQKAGQGDDVALPAVPKLLTNLKERATETGLISEETVLLTRRELSDTAVGKAADVQTQTRPVWFASFDDLVLYQPLLTQDIDGNLYLVTKVEDVPEKIPAFKDIRDEVLRAWKAREAAKLALKKAEELATEAGKAGDTLSTYFIGKPFEVITTDMFSYLTFGTTPAELQRGAKLGDAPPLEAVGPDFMEKAFELKDGEVAALLNYDQSKAYVFRLDRRETTPEELKALFLREANNWYGGQVMMLSRLQYQQQQVLEEVLERVDFDQEKLQEFLQPNGSDSEE